MYPVDLTEVDPGRFEILIGGDMTPGSGMTPIASQVMISPEQQVRRESTPGFKYYRGRGEGEPGVEKRDGWTDGQTHMALIVCN